MNNGATTPQRPVPPSQVHSSCSSPGLGSAGSTHGSHAGSQSSYTSISSSGPKTPSPSLPLNAITGPPTTIAAFDAMNSGGPTDMYYSHMSAGQPQQPQTVTSGPMSHYPAQPPLLQPGQPYTNGSPSPYGHYGYANGMTSPSAAPVPGNLPSNQPVLPLPGVGGQGAMQAHYTFDTSGQHPPPGMKPRVTATLWEDEGSLCFQVEARGICVARREDNHMINGTKLLNVAGMTRGRRDGILKSEKVRHVVKIGPMHLKGVWIPYDRALDFANKEKITELLYPLFVHNIGALLYHPTNQSRTSQVMAAAERRKQEQGQQQMRTPPTGLPSIQHQPHSMSSLPGPQSSLPSNNIGRPSLDRAATFPNPPTSTSSVMPNMANSEGFSWQGQGMNGTQGNNPIAMDANLGHARSMPTTPATTPPGTMQPYQPASQGYDSSRQMYSAPSSHHSPYPPSSNGGQDRLYGHGNSYAKNDMGPPSSRPSVSAAPSEHDPKGPNGILASDHPHQPHAGEEDGDHEHEAEYTHDSGGYESSRSYNYTAPGVGALAGDANNVDPGIAGSPSHPPTSGRATPRTTAQPQPYYSHNPGYGASPRVQQSGYYNGVGDRPVTNGGSGGDLYAPPGDISSHMSNGYSSHPPVSNGPVSGVKRGRDADDDVHRPMGDLPGMDLKRRKTIESSMPAPTFDSMSRAAPAIGADPRQR